MHDVNLLAKCPPDNEQRFDQHATVDVPARFRKSKSVGAVFGLTCSRDQSGERDRPGAISRCGDEIMRTMLYEAAQSMLRSRPDGPGSRLGRCRSPSAAV